MLVVVMTVVAVIVVVPVAVSMVRGLAATAKAVRVVMMVGVDRELAAWAEEALIGAVAAHRLGAAGAAHMLVEADHVVGRGHHHVEVVTDEENAATVAVADLPDQPVEIGLAGEVDALHRLVQHQPVGFVKKGAGQRHALELTARQALDLPVEEMRDPGLGEPEADRLRAGMPGEGHEPPYRQRQCRIECEALRHVADLEARLAFHRAGAGLEEAEEGLHQGRLPTAIGADEADDLAATDGQPDIVENDPRAAPHGQMLGGDEEVGIGNRTHFQQLIRSLHRALKSTIGPPRPWLCYIITSSI